MASDPNESDFQARALAIDIETSGLDFQHDKILEVGFVIREYKYGAWAKKNLAVGSILLWGEDYPDPVPPEIYRINRISTPLLQEAGNDPEHVWRTIDELMYRFGVTCIIAHNGVNFDKPFILAKTEGKAFQALPWIDTKIHLQYPPDCKANNLLYLAAYHGFLNPFPHDALSDVLTMMRVLEYYDFPSLYRRATGPWVLIAADVNFDGRELARARGYQWNAEVKRWEKRLPTIELEQETKEAPFRVLRAREL